MVRIGWLSLTLCLVVNCSGQVEELECSIQSNSGRISNADGQTLSRKIPAPAEFKGLGLPAYVFRTPDGSRYQLLYIHSLPLSHTMITLGLQILDLQGAPVKNWIFWVGWKAFFESAQWMDSDELKRPLFKITTSSMPAGRDIANQYYDLSDDRLLLVRIEKRDGKATVNDYMYRNMMLGLPPEAKSTEDWLHMLSSANTSEVLAALVFLAGNHTELVRPGEPRQNPNWPLYTGLMTDQRILARIAELRNTKDRLVREAALLVPENPSLY